MPFWVGAGIAGIGLITGTRAASKAAKQQEEATKEALKLRREMYLQQRADTAPFREVGSSAMTTLGGLMGLPQGQDTTLQPELGPNPRQFDPATNTGRVGVVRSSPPGTLPLDPYSSGSGALPGSMAGPGTWLTVAPNRPSGGGSFSVPGAAVAQSGSGYVTLQAPTGETQAVPADQADHYMQLGARRV